EAVRAVFLPQSKPDDPVAELQRAWNRYVEIERSADRLLSALAAVQTRERTAFRKFDIACQGEDADAINAALAEWLEIAPKVEHSQRVFNAVRQEKIYKGSLTKLKAEFPEVQSVLIRVVELRLAEAEERAATVLRQETARLKPENFSDLEIANSTRVARANGRVSHLETMLRRVKTEELESTWRAFTPRVLGG